RGSSIDGAARTELVERLARGDLPQGHAETLLRLGATRYMSGMFPLALDDSQTSAGHLVLLRDWHATEKLLDDLRRQLVETGIAIFAIALPAGFVFSRRTTRPIRDIAVAASEITGGNRTCRAPLKGSAEVVATAAAFNEMSAEL